MSPVAGIIDQRFIANGTQVAPLTPTPVAQVIGAGLKLKFTLPEQESVRVREGTPVAFRVMAFPNRDFKAVVYYASTLTDSKTRLVTCWANVDKTDALLKSGFFAKVRIVTEARGSAVVIPLTASLPTERGFVTFVVVDGKARRRPVELGMQVVDQGIEVLKGLAPGETLVVEGANALQEGALVREVEASGPGGAKAPAQAGERK
jgi:RND family efflux transporter MFP subunit